MSIVDQSRGPAPEIQEGTEVKIVATSKIYEIIKYGSNPEKDLPIVKELLGPGQKELESYLLFYENHGGTDRIGYESRIIGGFGIGGGRFIQDISKAIEELKHVGAIYLEAKRDGYVLRVEGITARKFGYSQESLVVTAEPLLKLVENTFTGMGCKLI